MKRKDHAKICLTGLLFVQQIRIRPRCKRRTF